MKRIIRPLLFLIVLLIISLAIPKSAKAQCSDPAFSNPICAQNSQPQTNCQNLGVNSFCSNNQLVLFCCSTTSFVTPTIAPGGNCQTAPYLYSACGSPSQPNTNCTNQGTSSSCGGTVNGLVLWCCSSPNFVTPTQTPPQQSLCPNQLYPHNICSKFQPNPDCENRGQNAACGGSSSGQNLWCCLTTNVLPPAPCPATNPYPYCGQQAANPYCNEVGKNDFCGGQSNPNNLFCCKTANASILVAQGQKIFCDSSGKATTDPSSGKLYTAIGCIPVSTINQVVGFFLPWFMGIAGGISLFLMIYAGFLITTSGGDRQKLQAGRELLTATISGLIILIFAVLVLRVIGKNILSIPNL